MKRLIAAILLLSMLSVSFAACNKTPNTPDAGTTDAAGTTAPAETLDPNDRKNVKDNLPENFDMNQQTVGVLTRHTYRKIDWDGDGAEEVLAQAVYNRTEAVKERLNVQFALTDMDLGYDDYGAAIKEAVMAGDDDWQIILAAGNASIRLGSDNLFVDVTNNKYLDFDQPWWAKESMEAMSIDGETIRYMMGDAIMNTYYWASVMFFNKNLYEENFGSADTLYEKALNRDWYYDDMIKMVEQAANDVDGDGVMDTGDTFGFFSHGYGDYLFLERASGYKQWERNEDGIPQINHDQERATEVLDVLYRLAWETKGSTMDINREHPSGNSNGHFTDGNILFYYNTLSNTDTDNFRNMEADYGILPIPLIDEKQTEYISPITTSATFLTIPKTCANPDDIGAVIEALSSESYRSVVEVFYESALKMKYSRDSYSGQVIDIVRETLYKDFMYEYYVLSNMCYDLIRDCVYEGTKAYTSKYNAEVTAANKAIIDGIKAIQKSAEE